MKSYTIKAFLLLKIICTLSCLIDGGQGEIYQYTSQSNKYFKCSFPFISAMKIVVFETSICLTFILSLFIYLYSKYLYIFYIANI